MSQSQRRKVPGSGLLIFSFCCAILYLARDVLIPIALAALLSLFLVPIVNKLRRFRIPNVASVLIAVGICAVVVLSILWLGAQQLSGVLSDFPKYRKNISARIHGLSDSRLGEFAGSVSDLQQEIVDGSHLAPPPQPNSPHQDSTASDKQPHQPHKPTPVPVRVEQDHSMQFSDYLAMLSTAAHPFSMGVMILLLTAFMLAQRDDLRDRLLIIAGKISGPRRLPVSSHAIDDAISTIIRYLLMQSASNACMAAVMGIGLGILGIPDAVLWGSMCFFLRFIPYIGIVIAAGITFLFSMATSPDIVTPFLAVGLFAVVEFSLSSFLEPLFFSHTTGLSSLAILFSALFWTWIWGIPGLFLSIPLTSCCVMIGRNFEDLDFLETLLGRRDQVSAGNRLFNQLLVLDPTDFYRASEQHMQTGSAYASFDDVLVPTICLAESALLAERITPERFTSIRDSLQLSFDRALSRPPGTPSSSLRVQGPPAPLAMNPEQPAVLCIPSYTDLDDLSSRLVSQALMSEGCRAKNSGLTPPQTIIQTIRDERISAICICVLCSHSSNRALTWTRLLRQHFPDIVIVIGMWNRESKVHHHIAAAQERYNIEVVTRLKDAAMHLSSADIPMAVPAAASAATSASS